MPPCSIYFVSKGSVMGMADREKYIESQRERMVAITKKRAAGFSELRIRCPTWEESLLKLLQNHRANYTQ